MRAVRILLAGGAILIAVTALATIVPAPTRSLLPLSVGAPELSAIVLIFAAFLLMSAPIAGRRARRPIVLIALASMVPLSRPLVLAMRSGPDVDAALERAFGAGFLSRNTSSLRLRAAPMRIGDLLTGVRISPEPIVTDTVFASPAGVPLTVRSYRPSGGSRHPVVVQIYGGAWQRGASADDPVLARYLASRGYVVYAVDYRHAPAFRWPAQLEDLRLGLRWVEAHAADSGGDASAIGLLGRSAGAHLALMLAYTAGSPSIRGVVSLYGPVDLTRGYQQVPSPDPIDVRATLEALMGGKPAEIGGAYREASPITYASRPQPPTMQIIGARDHIVLPIFPAGLDGSLRAAGNRSVLIELPWADHAFDAVSFGPSGQLTLYATERFLAATIGQR